MPFFKNQVIQQSSDLIDTADHCLNYYGMFFVWYVRTLSVNGSHPKILFTFFVNEKWLTFSTLKIEHQC